LELSEEHPTNKNRKGSQAIQILAKEHFAETMKRLKDAVGK